MELETGEIEIGKFNDLYTKGVIKPYKNNRGGKIYDSKRVNKYASAWDTASSGCALLEKTRDGYMLRDFHNRAEAIKRGVASTKINPKEKILLRIIPPGVGLDCYKNINAAKGHTQKDKLTNPDLFFGNEIAQIIGHSQRFDIDNLPTKFYRQLANAVIDLKIKRRSEFSVARDVQHQVARWRDASVKEAEEMALTDNNRKKLASAVDFYGVVRDGAMSHSESKLLDRIFANGMLFGLVVFDYMYIRKLGPADRVAKNIAENARKVEAVAGTLGHGTLDARLDAQKQLMAILAK